MNDSVDIWQNQYNIVKLKNKRKEKKEKNKQKNKHIILKTPDEFSRIVHVIKKLMI